jgi:hypothetical protein
MSKFLHGPPKFSRGPSVGDRWSSPLSSYASAGTLQFHTSWKIYKKALKHCNGKKIKLYRSNKTRFLFYIRKSTNLYLTHPNRFAGIQTREKY